MQRNRALALAGRKSSLCQSENTGTLPSEFIASLASIPLPAAALDACPAPSTNEYPLQNRLRMNHGIGSPYYIVVLGAAPCAAHLRAGLQFSAAIRELLKRHSLRNSTTRDSENSVATGYGNDS